MHIRYSKKTLLTVLASVGLLLPVMSSAQVFVPTDTQKNEAGVKSFGPLGVFLSYITLGERYATTNSNVGSSEPQGNNPSAGNESSGDSLGVVPIPSNPNASVSVSSSANGMPGSQFKPSQTNRMPNGASSVYTEDMPEPPSPIVLPPGGYGTTRYANGVVPGLTTESVINDIRNGSVAPVVPVRSIVGTPSALPVTP